MASGAIHLSLNGKVKTTYNVKNDIVTENGQEIGYIKNGCFYDRSGKKLGSVKIRNKKGLAVAPPPIMINQPLSPVPSVPVETSFSWLKSKIWARIYQICQRKLIVANVIILTIIVSLGLTALKNSPGSSGSSLKNSGTPGSASSHGLTMKSYVFGDFKKGIRIVVTGRLGEGLFVLILTDPQGKRSRIGSVAKDDLFVDGKCERETLFVEKGKNTITLQDYITERVVCTEVVEVP